MGGVIAQPFNMNAQTITEKLFDKADAELIERITKSTQWIYDESQSLKRPIHEDFPKIVIKGDVFPWIGESWNQFRDMAYAYLRDVNRQKAIQGFMAKVNSMAEEMENLGIVVRNSEQQP